MNHENDLLDGVKKFTREHWKTGARIGLSLAMTSIPASAAAAGLGQVASTAPESVSASISDPCPQQPPEPCVTSSFRSCGVDPLRECITFGEGEYATWTSIELTGQTCPDTGRPEHLITDFSHACGGCRAPSSVRGISRSIARGRR
jgi:hypothetical protein